MKNSKISRSIIAILLISLISFSCKKHHHDEPLPESVVINIITPTEAQEFEKGDTVFIKANITSLSQLHGYEVHVTRLADSAEILNKDIDAHAASFDISEYFLNDGAVHSEMELEIIAVIDHSGNQASKKIKFHCHDH